MTIPTPERAAQPQSRGEQECPPHRIYLQWHGDGEPENPAGVRDADVTWSRDQVFDSDVEYRRSDTFQQMLQALKDVDKAYQEMFDVMPVAFQTYAHIVEAAIVKATQPQ